MFPTTAHAPSYSTSSSGAVDRIHAPRSNSSPNVSEPAGEPAVMSNPVTPTRRMNFDTGNTSARSSQEPIVDQEVHYVKARNLRNRRNSSNQRIYNLRGRN